MTHATLERSRKVNRLMLLAQAHRMLTELRRTLAQLPCEHPDPLLLRDLNRLELRLLSRYQWTPDALPFPSSHEPHPFQVLIQRARSSSL
jgi:hypothetical protein